MERKSTAGSIRNKERSKKKFLDAVGKILKTKGYAALKINDIASVAGVDKKMIYTYFGGLDDLMDEYIYSSDYYNRITTEEIKKIKPKIDDGGRSFMKEMLHSQFDDLYKNKEAQKLLLWRLSESRKSLRKMSDAQEKNSEYIFKLMMDSHFKDHSQDFRAMIAIVVSGLYYLNLRSSVESNIFCGVDITSTDGHDNIKRAVSFLIGQAYDHL